MSAPVLEDSGRLMRRRGFPQDWALGFDVESLWSGWMDRRCVLFTLRGERTEGYSCRVT